MADSRASDSRLRPCPRSPNCVSTRAEEDTGHRMEPIPLEGTPENALARFKQILSSRARTEVVEEEGWYLRAEETSALLRFVDDVEIEIDPRAAEIHFRSASRTGWSDLGVNRRRMKAIRAAYLGEGS
jgi:uncharacterized protein (DUF1499 family)